MNLYLALTSLQRKIVDETSGPVVFNCTMNGSIYASVRPNRTIVRFMFVLIVLFHSGSTQKSQSRVKFLGALSLERG